MHMHTENTQTHTHTPLAPDLGNHGGLEAKPIVETDAWPPGATGGPPFLPGSVWSRLTSPQAAIPDVHVCRRRGGADASSVLRVDRREVLSGVQAAEGGETLAV